MMLDDAIDFAKFFLVYLLIIIGFAITPIVFGVEWFSRKACDKYEVISGKNTEYTFFGGCYVESNSGMVTLKQYGQMLIAKEGLSIDRN